MAALMSKTAVVSVHAKFSPSSQGPTPTPPRPAAVSLSGPREHSRRAVLTSTLFGGASLIATQGAAAADLEGKVAVGSVEAAAKAAADKAAQAAAVVDQATNQAVKGLETAAKPKVPKKEIVVESKASMRAKEAKEAKAAQAAAAQAAREEEARIAANPALKLAKEAEAKAAAARAEADRLMQQVDNGKKSAVKGLEMAAKPKKPQNEIVVKSGPAAAKERAAAAKAAKDEEERLAKNLALRAAKEAEAKAQALRKEADKLMAAATKGNKAPEKAKPAKPKSDIVVKSGRQAAQERKAAEAEAARKQRESPLEKAKALVPTFAAVRFW